MTSIVNMRVIYSTHASEEVLATVWQEPPFSPHRSRRLWKKLRKKTARPHPRKPIILQHGNTLIVHPAFKTEIDRSLRATGMALGIHKG